MPSDPFLGEIFMAGFNFAPAGYQSCNGSLLSISSYAALFALLGTTFGGNGSTNFGIPNLQGRVPIGMGTGSGLSSRTLGEMAGTESVTLALSEMPAHTHTVNANTGAGTTSSPQGALWANTGALDKE
ncbi:MAG: tail fiber protein [Arachidicoccus sp.]|nr:tail fiber protein [Arachidicoccus sp.]